MVGDLVLATELTSTAHHTNAHARRILQPDAQDLIVRGRTGVSGRLERCLRIGDYREKAYRVWPDLMERKDAKFHDKPSDLTHDLGEPPEYPRAVCF